MSTEQTSQVQHSRDEAEGKRQEQSHQWREIGISAVAAAARQASGQHAIKAASTPANLGKRIVTLRDIDHVVA